MSKPIAVDRDIDEEILKNYGTFLGKRSKLHTTEIVRWLRSRHQKTSNLKYLFFPEELEKHIEIRKIFEKFDADNSGNSVPKKQLPF